MDFNVSGRRMMLHATFEGEPQGVANKLISLLVRTIKRNLSIQ